MAAATAPNPPTGPLHDRHDVLLVDLDGVVYLGAQPIPGAAAAVSAARETGSKLVFVTNNAARPPAAVAEQLTAMGIAAAPSEVMTSAMAAAGLLADRLPAGAAVLVVGGAGVVVAIEDAGLCPVERADAEPAAVVQGFAPEVGWRALAEASVALRAGAAWIATNADLTLPSPRGPLPGNGSLVAALAAATGLTPEVVGKPQPALFAAALRAAPAERPLVVGDRLDTDIAGAVAAGLPSLLVLTGVSTALDLLAAPQAQRPTYVGRDIGALGLAHPAALGQPAPPGAPPSLDGLDPLRALVAAAWQGHIPIYQYQSEVERLNLDPR